jgi:hypothetical protein
VKNGTDRTTVGAGWTTKYGGVSIKLNPCVTLTDRDDVWLLLKPNEWKDEEDGTPRKKRGKKSKDNPE